MQQVGSVENQRSIPAWAGETYSQRQAGREYGVYPRVGGGNPGLNPVAPTYEGLSPRGRGKLRSPLLLAQHHRSIPAWAGETPPLTAPGEVSRLYPRVGGGNAANKSPETLASGLSPRGRGKLWCSKSGTPTAGSIPAWAGETPQSSPNQQPSAVYPRVGGGNTYPAAEFPEDVHLSPRGRGKHTYLWYSLGHPGSIPAWAGETAFGIDVTGLVAVYPRVGGGNTPAAAAAAS